MVGELLISWRGRQTRNQDFQIPSFVPPPGPIEYIPSFRADQPFALARIANGEWVIRDPNAPLPEAPRPAAGTSAPRPKALAPLIDAMLLAGNMTMRGIVRELQRKASAACHGRDLRANVRARRYWLRKRGYLIRRNDQERLQAAPTPAARSASTLTGP